MLPLLTKTRKIYHSVIFMLTVTDIERRHARRSTLELKRKHVYQFTDMCFSERSCIILSMNLNSVQ